MLQKQFGRSTGQLEYIDGLIYRSRRCSLDILDLAQERRLFATPLGRFLVEKLRRDTLVELIQVHGVDAGLDLVIAALQPFDGLFASRLFGLVGFKYGVVEPFENATWDDKLPDNAGEGTSEDFLSRVRLWALPPVPSAVVVHIATLLDFPHQQASTVTALHQTLEGEVMFHFSGLALRTGVQELLDPLPALAGHERFVSTSVHTSVPVELTHVQTFPENLVDCALVKLPALQSDAFGPELRHE